MNKYYQAGSYKGVPFQYLEDTYSHRMKEAEQNFLASDSETETLGKEPLSFVLTVFVFGKDAVNKRNKLIKALEDETAGVLVHPQYGKISVKVSQEGFDITSSFDKGNYYEFNINFIKVDKNRLNLSVLPVQANPNDKLIETALKSTEVSKADFIKSFETKGFLESVADEAAGMADKVCKEITSLTSQELLPFSTVAKIKSSIDMIGASMSSLLDVPSDFVNNLIDVLSFEGATYNFFKRLSDLNFELSKPKFLTDTRRQSLKNQQAIQSIVKQVSVIKALELGIELKTASETEISNRILELTELAQTIIDTSESVNIQQSFEEVLQASVSALQAQKPVKTKTVTPTMTLPSVVLLHQAGGVQLVNDAQNFNDRNQIRNPLFVNKKVEVAYD